MRTEGFRHGLISISLIFALVLSTAFIPTRVHVAAFNIIPEVQRWDALITATFPGGSDDAIFGVRPDATAGFDSAYDLPEPPPPVDPPYVQAFFHYPGNAPLPTRLHRSCIPPGDIMEWPLRVSYRNGTDNIILSWNLENVPADYAVLLFEGENLVADMRAVDNYTFQTASSDFDFTVRVEVAVAWQLIETWIGTIQTPVPPAAPSLISPVDGTITNDNTPTFDWSDVTGAENYDLLVDNDPDFSSPEIQVTVSVSTYTPTAGLPDDNYSWRVRARDAANNVSDNSATWSFLIDSVAPSAPTPYLPADGTLTNDDTVYFEWSSIAGSEYYNLFVDNDSDFGSPEVSVTITDNYYTSSALPDENYSWRVRARDAANNVSDNSATWSFLIDTNAPATPTLVSPGDNAVENALTQTFKWTEPEAGVTYHIQIDEEASFTSPYVHENTAVTDNSYSHTLSTDGTYYWRVSAIDAANNEGPFADSYNFTIATQAPTSSVDPISPYWRTSVPFAITATASDATSGVASVGLFYRYSTDNFAWGAWTSFGIDTASPWSFSFTAPSGDGYYEFYSIASDVSTNTESAPAAADAIAGVDTTAPTGSVVINDGAAYTTSTSVTLSLTHTDATSGVSQVRYSNDNIWDTEPWEDPSATRAWTLPDGDGTKTVYYQIKDRAGLLSTAYPDTIILDTTLPYAPALVSPSDGAVTKDNKPTFDWDDVMGAVEYQLQVDNDPDFSSPEIQVTVTVSTYTPTVELPEDNYSWRVQARDAANNLSGWSAVWTFFVAVRARAFEVPIPLAISAFLIGAAILTTDYLLRVRPKKAARRRVLRGPRRL